jgi:hypothetical protein
MELTGILCNHAEVQNNLLYVSGGGIDRVGVPGNIPGPWNINLAIGMNISVPWTETNKEHVVTVDLVDFDSHPVLIPSGVETVSPLRVEMKFNVGRPPTLEVGESQSISLAINLPALPISEIGNYSFILNVDGSELRRLSYRVVKGPNAPM